MATRRIWINRRGVSGRRRRGVQGADWKNYKRPFVQLGAADPDARRARGASIVRRGRLRLLGLNRHCPLAQNSIAAETRRRSGCGVADCARASSPVVVDVAAGSHGSVGPSGASRVRGSARKQGLARPGNGGRRRRSDVDAEVTEREHRRGQTRHARDRASPHRCAASRAAARRTLCLRQEAITPLACASRSNSTPWAAARRFSVARSRAPWSRLPCTARVAHRAVESTDRRARHAGPVRGCRRHLAALSIVAVTRQRRRVHGRRRTGPSRTRRRRRRVGAPPQRVTCGRSSHGNRT